MSRIRIYFVDVTVFLPHSIYGSVHIHLDSFVVNFGGF